MTISSILFLHFILLGLFNGRLSYNPDAIMAQSPADNEGRTREIQMGGLSPNSKSVTAQRENNDSIIGKMQTKMFSAYPESITGPPQADENERTDKIDFPIDYASETEEGEEEDNESTEKFETKNLSNNSEVVIVQSQEDNSGQNDKIKIEDQVSNFKSVVVENKVENSSRTGRNEMGYLSTDPEIEMLQDQGNTNEKTGKLQVPRFVVLRYGCYPSCPNPRDTWEILYEKTTDRIQTVSPYLAAKKSSRIPPQTSKIQQTPPSRVNGNNNNNNNQDYTVPITSPSVTTIREAFDDKTPGSAVIKPPGTIDARYFASLVNNFAFKLVENLNSESNLVISPLSIFVALAMCYLGSDSNTKTELERAFGIKEHEVNGERFHRGIENLLSLVLKETPGYELSVANGMFLGKDFTVDPQFEDFIRRYYGAELAQLDFRSPNSLRFINEWVSRSTRNMITSIIEKQPDILTRLILLNAVYFKGIWKLQFPSSKTYDGKFYTLDRKEKRVQFMRLLEETFPIYQSVKYRHTFIKLPYDGEEVSMIIALPLKGQKPMTKITDADLYDDVLQNMAKTEIDTVAIPKFRLEFKTGLKRALQALGINDIFDSTVSDLSKIRNVKDLYLSKIVHKAVVEVNEVGTTAAAITSDFVGLEYKNRTNFIADHPFAFYIVHEATGLVLFYGKVYDLGSEISDSYDRRENGHFRPGPVEASDSNDRRENRPFRLGPERESDSIDRRGNGPSRLRPGNSDNRGGNVPYGRRPGADSNYPRRNSGSGSRSSETGNNQGGYDRFRNREEEVTESNAQRTQRPYPRPSGGSGYDMYGG